jgi:hypothetical protein
MTPMPTSVQCQRVKTLRGEVLDQSMRASCVGCHEQVWLSLPTREMAKRGDVRPVCEVCKDADVKRPANRTPLRLCTMCKAYNRAVIAVSNGIEVTKCSLCDVRRCRDCADEPVLDPHVKRCTAGHHLVGN